MPAAPPESAPRPRRQFPWLVVPLVAIAARLAIVIPAAQSPLADPDNYLPLARSVAQGDGLAFNGRPTAYRPPLYPLLLAAGLSIPGLDPNAWVLGLPVARGAASAALTARAATRWGLPRGAATFAGLVVALDPVLVIQARSVMTETLAAFLVALALALAAPRPSLRQALALGAVLGLAALCRPSLLPVAPLAAIVLATQRRPGPPLAMLAATLLVLTPWAARNAQLFGEPVWTTTHGGYTLALANNPTYYNDVLPRGPAAVWSGPEQLRWFQSVNESTARLTEPQADRALRAQALATIRARPADFARATLHRLARLWALAPSAEVYSNATRWLAAAWTLPLALALAIGLARLRRHPAWPYGLAAAFLVGLTLVHALYWTDLRMRAPIVPAIALIAALALAPNASGTDSQPAVKHPDRKV
jgi:4-amino-4-deoxy-L-arabinose transferase-like glycosyltransferase